jgi:hypothetical protein
MYLISKNKKLNLLICCSVPSWIVKHDLVIIGRGKG